MRRAECLILSSFVATWLCYALPPANAAPTVWTGLTFDFANTFASPAQDMITPNVILARASTSGLFNAATESFYSVDVSPASTLWATEFNNDPGVTISANNWEALTFTDWRTAYGGANSLASDILDNNAVLYLETDDIYLDIRFLEWGQGHGNGGTFHYLRSEPVPEPASGISAALLASALGLRRSRRKNP
jgi:hypothetical protein